MTYLQPFRLSYRSKLGHEVVKTVTRHKVSLPDERRKNREKKEVLRAGPLLLEIRGLMVYLVGGYSSFDADTETWNHAKHPHFYGLGKRDAPLIGWLMKCEKIEYTA